MTHLLSISAAQVNIGPRCWIPDGCSVEIQHVCGVPDRRLPFPWEKRLSGNRHAPSGEKESLCLMSAVAILTACRRISCLNIEITAKRLVADIYSYRPPSSSSSSLFFLPGKEKGKKMRKITARHEFLFFNLIKKEKGIREPLSLEKTVRNEEASHTLWSRLGLYFSVFSWDRWV